MARRPRQALREAPQLPAVEIARVAAEELVAAVPGKRHCDMAPRHLGDEKGRDLRAVGERLVVYRREIGDHAQCMLGRDVEFRVVGAEMAGYLGGMRRLVETALAETDREAA